MKTLLRTLLLLVTLSSAIADTAVKAGPRKGRLLEISPTQSAEFFVEKDRTISIAFYDAALKAQPPAAQVVTATAETPAGKTKIDFAPKGKLLLATAPLPTGEDYQVVIQVKPDANSKPKNFRIKLLLYTCKECGNAEYACICDH
ncbi:hypothetical protein [Prosthecobacter sp.]|uniref:hypothetical protein n=1 Tax=Prosthecobacter sp. TaxID=1965333 RepID=UPI0024899560|nr:hypothetical protein [Prosthecobacter sp.]MDI1312231.1 hypothetical protein [Prosthecobacter sp.]